jgi:hypothetical protein
MDRPTPQEPVPEPEPSLHSTPEWAVRVGAGPHFAEPETFPLLSTAPKARDPLAVALGNGSLFGVGYGMLGRWWLAVSTSLVTVVLVLVLAVQVRAVWLEFVILGWWLALVVHGWVLARRRPRPEGRVLGQRLVAFGALLPVLLVFGIFRFDAARIEDEVATAKNTGDCAGAMAALDRREAGHRIADAPGTATGDSTVRACNVLAFADQALDDALTGDTERLGNGYGELATVLREYPGHEKMVEHVLAGFLARLPKSEACDTVAVTDWLRQRRTDNDILKRAGDTVPRVAPSAIVACADALVGTDLEGARDHYQQLLDQYPDHDLVAKATQGVTTTTQAIELANVRQLFTTQQYCSSPAPYSAAAPIGAGPNRAAIFGTDEYANRLPAEWRATDATDTVLVICARPTTFGTPVQTCPYEDKSSLSIAGYRDVTFRNVAIPVRVFELRTGQLVAETTVEIGGASCPAILQYTTYFPDSGPPGEVYVAPSDGDVHNGFRGLIDP